MLRKKEIKIEPELYDELRAFIVKTVRNESDASDILHDALMAAQEKSDTLNDPEKFKSWVYQIVRNKITDFYRSKKDTVELDDQCSEGQQGRRIEIRGACSLLSYVLNQLPQMYREVFELSEKGISHKEIADSLGISVDLSKQRLSRAKKMLEEELQHTKCTRVHIDPKDMSVTVSEEKITLEQAKIIDEMINERKDDL